MLSHSLLFFAAALAASVVVAQTVDDYIDPSKHWTRDKFKIGKDNETVLSGPDGVFDDDLDAMDNAMNSAATPAINDTRSAVCEDFMAYNGIAAPGPYIMCISNNSDTSYTLKCNGKGKCMAKGKNAVAGQFAKAPCDYFADVMAKKGELCGYFCVGNTGGYLLQCPEGHLRKCEGGCRAKMESGVQCGKAACKAKLPKTKSANNYGT